MVKRKRSYIPKIRGCYECSQRRIHCDRARPNCAKCISKGIQCSGLGVRYRFHDDVIAKGRNCEDQATWPSRRSATSNLGCSRRGLFTPATTRPRSLVEARLTSRGLRDSGDLSSTALESMIDEELKDIDPILLELDAVELNLSVTPHQCSDLVITEHTPTVWTNSLYTIEAWQEYLFQHFANKIASELVIVDDQNNGWRWLVLPIAQSDELVRDAVLSASAFHFATNVDDGTFGPHTLYARAIDKLRKRQDLQAFDAYGQQTVLLSLLVILTSFMVNGSADFRAVFKLIEDAVTAVGGEATITGELGRFIIRQIHKLRGYASPLLDTDLGVSILERTAAIRPSNSDGWQCFRFYYGRYPQFANPMDLVYELNEQACNIYVTRARAVDGLPPMEDLVAHFKDTIESFPLGEMEHVLVWPTFIAAAESTKPEHQEYFSGLLMKHYQRNGFRNLPLAINYLESMWANGFNPDWARSLSHLPFYIV